MQWIEYYHILRLVRNLCSSPTLLDGAWQHGDMVRALCFVLRVQQRDWCSSIIKMNLDGYESVAVIPFQKASNDQVILHQLDDHSSLTSDQAYMTPSSQLTALVLEGLLNHKIIINRRPYVNSKFKITFHLTNSKVLEIKTIK